MARKNTTQVAAAFNRGQPLKSCKAIWTDGSTIFSYGTAIMVRLNSGRTIANRTSYSVTTSVHQNGLSYLLAQPDYTVTDIPMGASRATLIDAAIRLPLAPESLPAKWVSA